MAELVDFKDKLKRYFLPDRKELFSMLPAILVAAFIISFKEWGAEQFDWGIGLVNFARAVVIVSLSFFIFDAGQRLFGLSINYRLRYKVWTIGLLIGLVVCVITNGNIWLILPSGFLVEHLTGYRLGWFRYGINVFGQGIMSLGGPIACILLIIIIKLFSFALPATFVDKAILFNVIFAAMSMLPIPPLAGSKVYFGSRMLYAFSMPAIIGVLILLSLNISILLSVGLSIIIGVVLWISYYLLFEQTAWRGPG